MSNDPMRESWQPRGTICASCGAVAQPMVSTETVSIRHDGRLYEITVRDLPVLQCPSCGESHYDNQSDDRIQRALREHLGFLMPEQIAALRGFWGLTQDDIERDTGIAAETLSRWENGRVIQSRSLDVLLRNYLADPVGFRQSIAAPTTEPRWVPTQMPVSQPLTFVPVVDALAASGRHRAPDGGANSNYSLAA